MDYEGPLRIPKNEKLPADEAEVEARFAAQIQGRLDEVIAEYLARFRTVIDTDRARELCGDYSATKATRTRFSRAVYNPAKALADEIYRREIRKTAPPSGWRVLFTSGGTGAGKSTALAWFEEHPGLTTDMTYSWTARCRTTRQRGQRYGGRSRWAAALRLFTSIPFAETVRMVVKRAIEMGRAVTLDNIAVTHFRSRETLFKLAQEFGERINIRVVENSGDEPARPFPWRNWQANEARALTICANWRTLFLSINSAASKLITRKSMKPSSKKVLGAKVRRRAVPAEEKNVADRVVESIVRRTGKFPKVY